MKPSERRIMYSALGALLLICTFLLHSVAEIAKTNNVMQAEYEALVARVENVEEMAAQNKPEDVEAEIATKEIELEELAVSEFVFPDIILKSSKTMVEKREYGRAVYSIAKHYEEESGVPAAIMTAISALECGWGTSPVAVYKHNILGINGENGYRYFNSVEECVKHFYETTMRLDQYAHLLGADISTWVNGLGPAGYHESGDAYIRELKSVLNLLDKWGVTSTLKGDSNG